MMAFMQYVMQVIMSFMLLSMVLFMLPRAAVSAERIAEVLALPLTVKDPENPVSFDDTQKGVVVFNNVSFRHHGAEENALTDLSFTAKPGETTAIIGATGSGKSTLANLLLRFYDVSAGKITVGGADIRQVKQADLRSRIGYVPQKGQLLTGTVADNIRYGRPDADENEIKQAADAAQATEFIDEKENGMASEISQSGANVSGGQKQRLSIARALAKKSEIFVFDDSFSALDFKTDAKLRSALKEYAADATMIIIAQRIGTIMNAEQIFVLDEGKIVGRGTHTELLATCPTYAEMALSQIQGGGVGHA
jgi:ATP-binding cassette subfamily B protein